MTFFKFEFYQSSVVVVCFFLFFLGGGHNEGFVRVFPFITLCSKQGGGRVSKFGTMCPTFHASLRVSVCVWVLSIFVLVRL